MLVILEEYFHGYRNLAQLPSPHLAILGFTDQRHDLEIFRAEPSEGWSFHRVVRTGWMFPRGKTETVQQKAAKDHQRNGKDGHEGDDDGLLLV